MTKEETTGKVSYTADGILSACCKAKTEVGGNVTRYFICTKCHKACEMFSPPSRLRKLFDKLKVKF